MSINKVRMKRWFENNWFIYGYCLLLSLIFLLICTKSSPLYPFNDWVDANASFTMGKAMMNGRVLYRDVFDHRGPLLYFIYGIGYLISNMDFKGVFVLEILSFSVFLFFSYKSISLFVDKKYSLLGLILITGLVLNFPSFSHGGSPEELCLPFISISLYYLLRYFLHNYPANIPNRWIFINGIIAGCVLWIKYTILGFWIGWMLAILIDVIIKKQFLRALRICFIFLAGMVVATLPWVIYFGVSHSIYDWINAYFTINILYYSKPFNFLSRLIFLVIGPFDAHFINLPSIILISLGFFTFLLNKTYIVKSLHKLSLLLCYLILVFSMYGGGVGQTYYLLVFAPFLIFGIVVFLNFLRGKIYSYENNKPILGVLLVALGLLIGTYLFSILNNQNIYLLQISKNELVQFKYAEIINSTENASLLNYGGLDSGFFTAAGIIPTTRFFYEPNIDSNNFPLIKNEQNRYIEEQLIDYVIIPIHPKKSIALNEVPFLYDNYSLTRDDVQTYEDVEIRYLLFKKKE